MGEESAPDLSQVDLLEVIMANQPILMGDLAAKSGIDMSTATRAIDKLEKRGLVFRRRRTDNARYIAVSLTEVGAERCATFVANRRRAMHRILAEFDGEDRETLARLLERLAHGLSTVVTEDTNT